MLATIGIDPGGNSGLALWVDGELSSYLKVKVPHIGLTHRVSTLRNLASQIIESPGEYTVSTFVEDQWLGLNPQSMIRTVESAVSWQIAASLIGLNASDDRVLPSVWHSTFGFPRSMPKGLSVSHVRNREPLAARLGVDCCEAVMIGLHCHLRDLRLSGRTIESIELLSEWRL